MVRPLAATMVLASVAMSGCANDQALLSTRPCGPGYLDNAFVPQGFVGADFRPACRQHDLCYMNGRDRKECDLEFRDDMLKACECSDHPTLCRLKACQWYLQVRVLGGLPYLQSLPDGGSSTCGCSDAQADVDEIHERPR